MSALTCDICGGNLAMNESGEFAICESCGMKHTKERVKVKVQEVTGVVEITKGETEKNRLLENAKQLFDIKEYPKSAEIYYQITKDFPADYFAWTQRAYVNLLWKIDDESGVNSDVIAHSDDLARCLSFIETAKKLNAGFDESLFWASIVDKHGNDLLIREKRHTDDCYKCTYTILNTFDAELICFDTDKLHPVLQDLQIKISQQYSDKFLSGELLLFCKKNHRFDCVHTEFWGQTCHYHCYMANELPYKNAIMQKLYDEGLKRAKHANALKGDSYERVLFSLATARVVCNGDYSKVYVTKISSDNIESKKTQAINDKCNEAKKLSVGMENCESALQEILTKFTRENLERDILKKIYNCSYRIINIASNEIEYEITYSNMVKYHYLQNNEKKERKKARFKADDLNEILRILRRYNQKCSYCGGNFKGIFTKVCTTCGKTKNY